MSGGVEQHTRCRILGLFAHPDDEVFCAGGAISAATRDGAEALIVSFTHGEAGLIRHADIATRSTLGTVRAAELAASCAHLGVSNSACLDFADGSLGDAPREELIESAVRVIRSFRPDTVYSFDQTGAYGHPDHIAMSEVSIAACLASGDAAAFPDAGDPFSPAELLHARFPRCDRLLLQVLVEWLTGLDDRFRGTDEFTNALLMFADGTSMLGYASDHLDVQWFPAGSYVIEQGDVASSLYLVLSGRVDVIVEDDAGSTAIVGSVGTGEFIGETGIAAGAVRGAHCVATENTTCFVLSPHRPSNHAAHGVDVADAADTDGFVTDEALSIDFEVDVAAHVPAKVRALAEHRSQYSLSPGLFPDGMLHELLGVEYFHRAWSANACDDKAPRPR